MDVASRSVLRLRNLLGRCGHRGRVLTAAVVWVTLTVDSPRRLSYWLRASAPLLAAPQGMRTDLELRRPAAHHPGHPPAGHQPQRGGPHGRPGTAAAAPPAPAPRPPPPAGTAPGRSPSRRCPPAPNPHRRPGSWCLRVSRRHIPVNRPGRNPAARSLNTHIPARRHRMPGRGHHSSRQICLDLGHQRPQPSCQVRVLLHRISQPGP
jgi:hypothetical protein